MHHLDFVRVWWMYLNYTVQREGLGDIRRITLERENRAEQSTKNRIAVLRANSVKRLTLYNGFATAKA